MNMVAGKCCEARLQSRITDGPSRASWYVVHPPCLSNLKSVHIADFVMETSSSRSKVLVSQSCPFLASKTLILPIN